MVKADFDRDYYADLEIDQSASINEIKKQFRKLALVYHPDRNLGNESDMNAKFQAIQSAHEVLTDPLERQRYDDMRSRVRYTTASAFRSTKGNPYSNYGSEFPRPPKPPPYRPNRNPPPQSAGAARYSTFQTPRQSASAAAQEGAEARKSTFNAWESMKGHQKTSSASASYRTGSGPTWNTPKAGPKEHVPQSSRAESSSFKYNVPPRPKPGFEEFRSDSYHTRNPSNPPPIPKRNGFMPSNPGADEPSAGKGNYSTSRINRSVPPPPPPRETPSPEQEDEEIHTPAPAPPVNHTTRPSTKPNDPLRQFRAGEDPPYEPRLSTPYASSGGEKFDPFDAANLGRSKNTREEFAEPKPKKSVPRAGSDPNIASPRPNGTPKNDTPKNDTPKNDTPKNDTPKNDTPKNGVQKPTPAFATSPDSSDSGNGPEINPQKPRVFAKPRKPVPAQEQRQPDAAAPGAPSQNGPPAQEEPKAQPSIFSMKLDDETFSPTRPNAFPRGSADSINTKFSSEEWHGKFEAGGDYFVPEPKTTQIPLHSRVRTQSSSSRSRGRSPVKSRSADSKPFPSRPGSDTPIESPGGTKFSAQDWAETFKPQTFAPPSVPSPTKASVPSRVGSRKPRAPIARATVSSAAIVIEDDSDDSDGKPLFKGRVPSAPKPPTSPDAMDVDSPPATPAPPPTQAPPAQAPPAQAPPAQAPPAQAPPVQAQSPKANSGLKINTEQLKRAAAPSQSPVDTESLKVEFDDLNIKELLSSLDLPPPPIAPRYSHESNTALSQGIYLSAFTAYMVDWDLFAKRMMLHLIARKNQNDGLGSNRWENPQGLDIYRRGLKEDGAVMSHWVAAMASHDQAMKEYAIHKERFNMTEGRDRDRPRKKTH
ncbi:hypothetical protein EYC80_003223 [Monilinia laxa]|uniref:J domain-containing protein n=1 Tax=Monilinia laxa TaxID=61186 RepID=A0A5N6KEC5_MONLA|nr:hypothetical protein EYC80_003223 [Monilinia laxa]